MPLPFPDRFRPSEWRGLIARELERRAATGELDSELVAGVRDGDLTAWLRRRLAEHGLRSRQDLGDSARDAIDYALRWLQAFPLEREASFVLGRLLGRKDLDPAQKAMAISSALRWLSPHATSEDAEFVLRRLLLRKGLTSLSGGSRNYGRGGPGTVCAPSRLE